MEKSLVVYATRAGSSKIIAERIADALQCEVVSVKKCKQNMIYDASNIIYIGGIRMNIIYKYKKFALNMNLNNKRLITVAVGLTYPEQELIEHIELKNHHDINASVYEFAYLQGAFDIDKVKTKLEKLLLEKLADGVVKKGADYIRSASEKNIVKCVAKPHNFFRNHHIAPILNIIDENLGSRIPMTLQMEYDDEGVALPQSRLCVLDMQENKSVPDEKI